MAKLCAFSAMITFSLHVYSLDWITAPISMIINRHTIYEKSFETFVLYEEEITQIILMTEMPYSCKNHR